MSGMTPGQIGELDQAVTLFRAQLDVLVAMVPSVSERGPEVATASVFQFLQMLPADKVAALAAAAVVVLAERPAGSVGDAG